MRRRARLAAYSSGIAAACRNVFKTAPSSATIPDYYEYVDRKDVITWTSLKKRQHTSRRALLEDIDRMAQNANKYNQGGLVRNPAFVPGGGEPEMIKRKPGLYALPELPARMDAFRKRVTDLLYGRFRTKVRVLRACVIAYWPSEWHWSGLAAHHLQQDRSGMPQRSSFQHAAEWVV